MSLRRGEKPKLSADEETALLTSLKIERELVAHAKLQVEAHAVACKLHDGGMEIAKIAEEAAQLAAKDRKNFGFEQKSAVAAITLNAVLCVASANSKVEAGGGKGGKGKGGYNAKAKAKPKIGAKIERLPPPTCEAAKAAITTSTATLAKVSSFPDGQLALLRAFESWLLLEHIEPVLADASSIMQAFHGDPCLVEKEVFIQYWNDLQSKRELHGAEQLTAQATSKDAGAESADARANLKAAEQEMKDADQRARWAAAEVSNSRTGNQPTEPEVQRERAAAVSNTKALASKLQQTKVLELCTKKNVTATNASGEEDKALATISNKLAPLELMDKHTRKFFESLINGTVLKEPEADAALDHPSKGS